MARPLLELVDVAPAEIVEQRDNQATWMAAGSLAAALSVLAIAALVVSRSGNLHPAGTVAGVGLEAGTIALVDDDRGRLLFDLDDMGPGQPVDHCVELTYDGTIVPVDLAMRAEVSGELVRYLDVTVESGDSGGFDDCTGFVRGQEIFDGGLEQLASQGWVELGQLLNTGDQRSYRVTFEMEDNSDALERDATISILWEVTPS